MKTIIVATDFSATATSAVYYAGAMADSIDADLVLVHFYQIPLLPYEVPVLQDMEMETRRCEIELIKLCNEVKDATENKINISTRFEICNFYEGLQSVCAELNPYAVVLGSQGTTAGERFLMGGHTVYAMKHLPWPVITVPQGTKFSDIRKIGLACDLKNLPESPPLEELMILVNDFHTELHVLNIGKANKFEAPVVYNASVLSRMMKKIEPTFHFLTNNDTDRGIIEFAEQHEIDLLVIFPRRHSLLHNLVLGSHTKGFVLHSLVPVMALQGA